MKKIYYIIAAVVFIAMALTTVFTINGQPYFVLCDDEMISMFYARTGLYSRGNEFNMSKNLSHLNFMPTVLGRKTVRGVDLITNVILTTAIAVVIQF